MCRIQKVKAGNQPHAKAAAENVGIGHTRRICTLTGSCAQSARLEKVWDRRKLMGKSRANKQNRLRAQIKRQRNDVYKFKGAGKK